MSDPSAPNAAGSACTAARTRPSCTPELLNNASKVDQKRAGWASRRSRVSHRTGTAAVRAYHAMSTVFPEPGGPRTTVTGVVATRCTNRRKPGRTTTPAGRLGTPKRVSDTAAEGTAVDVIVAPSGRLISPAHRSWSGHKLGKSPRG